MQLSTLPQTIDAERLLSLQLRDLQKVYAFSLTTLVCAGFLVVMLNSRWVCTIISGLVIAGVTFHLGLSQDGVDETYRTILEQVVLPEDVAVGDYYDEHHSWSRLLRPGYATISATMWKTKRRDSLIEATVWAPPSRSPGKGGLDQAGAASEKTDVGSSALTIQRRWRERSRGKDNHEGWLLKTSSNRGPLAVLSKAPKGATVASVAASTPTYRKWWRLIDGELCCYASEQDSTLRGTIDLAGFVVEQTRGAHDELTLALFPRDALSSEGGDLHRSLLRSASCDSSRSDLSTSTQAKSWYMRGESPAETLVWLGKLKRAAVTASTSTRARAPLVHHPAGLVSKVAKPLTGKVTYEFGDLTKSAIEHLGMRRGPSGGAREGRSAATGLL